MACGTQRPGAVGKSPMRIPYSELFAGLLRVLLKLGFEQQRARLCAQLFADASRDGVYSHGLNRFPQFVRMIQTGVIAVDAEPELVASGGSLERWNGRSGPGNLNAYRSMDRAIALSRERGIGCVALANTNHWMRGGSYGWQAADAGVIGICWTNTMANLPPWGASNPRVGNNPLIIAVPRAKGHVVLDMAMSQFSYGALASYRMRGEQLPVAGGFDSQGRLTRDPAAIEASQRALPIGYWKGSGFGVDVGYGCRVTVRRPRHPSDTGRHGTRDQALAGVHSLATTFGRSIRFCGAPRRPDRGASAITPTSGRRRSAIPREARVRDSQGKPGERHTCRAVNLARRSSATAKAGGLWQLVSPLLD